MPKRALVLKHAPFEGPAGIAPLLTERGYALDVRELHRGAAVPPRVDPDDVLVVMGGSMGLADLGRPAFPYLRPELALLERCIDDEVAILGVCLGAQLLAHAAGADVYPIVDADGGRAYEVGWAPIRFHVRPDDPLLAGLPAEAPVLHWHGDTFDLPHGAHRFASTELCPQQGFQLGPRAFGLQFHCEVAAPEVEELLRHDGAFAERANGDGAADRVRQDTERYLPAYLPVGDRLLRNILDAMTK